MKHRDSGVYVNHDIVRLHRSMEKSDEPKSKRKSILAKFYSKKPKKPMSIELVTKGSENQGYTASRDEDHKEAYIDMAAMLEKRQVHAEAEEDPHSIYEEMGPDPRATVIHKARDLPDEEDLEDYENYNATQKKLQTDNSDCSDEQEDYENVQPESGISASGASSVAEGDDPLDDYENIENIDETFRSTVARGKAAATNEVDSDDSIEDYENSTRTKALQDSDSESLQDYENASTLKKR